MIDLLRDDSQIVRFQAIQGLGQFGVSDHRVVPAVLATLKDNQSGIRTNAISALAEIGPAAETAVSHLVPFLQTDDDWIAAKALGNIGPKAEAALPALDDLMRRSKGYARLNAAEAVWRIGRNADVAVDGLIASLHDEFAPIRRDAAVILGTIGPPVKDALPALEKMRDYIPAGREPSPERENADLPIVREMTEAEFYPQIRIAVSDTIPKIARRENRRQLDDSRKGPTGTLSQ